MSRSIRIKPGYEIPPMESVRDIPREGELTGIVTVSLFLRKNLFPSLSTIIKNIRGRLFKKTVPYLIFITLNNGFSISGAFKSFSG
jgi:hypothetical protein